MNAILKKAALFTLIACIGVSCAQSEAPNPSDEITVQLKWVHQAQFAGFYLAKEQGYYEKENLNVRFLEGGKGIDLNAVLTAGKADFAVLAPEDLLIGRSQGNPITAIAALYRRSAVVFVSKKGAGILRPSDFIGKTVAAKGGNGGIRDFELQFHALMKKLGLDVNRISLVPYDPEYKAFYGSTVDVTPAYLTGGVIKMTQAGHEIHFIWPGDYGIRFYSDTLATTEQMIDQEPELVTRFLRATLKGWKDAVGNQEDAVNATLKYAAIPDPALQNAMMEALLPLVHTGENTIGWMTQQEWEEMHRILHEQGVLPAPLPDQNALFTLEFLKTVQNEVK
jgi:NitT/TauT family transport system substrate-binding protein